ncbi:hypothetical protein [Demequina litorisediminis]|uniref:Uncharacterized protein n=1 Tax=Demequina litorisediminis TaxID=1849022 RepID=A0ABQ6IE56_9MICO|nr:hypothetical protein [Demequina litorisediminis]GMA35272.1 hypothetical protein GCM10025876_14760 [Demequina litorisediminis]
MSDSTQDKAKDLTDKAVDSDAERHDPSSPPTDTDALGKDVPHGDGEPRETDGQEDPA